MAMSDNLHRLAQWEVYIMKLHRIVLESPETFKITVVEEGEENCVEVSVAILDHSDGVAPGLLARSDKFDGSWHSDSGCDLVTAWRAFCLLKRIKTFRDRAFDYGCTRGR